MQIPVTGDSGLFVLPPPDIMDEVNRWRCLYEPRCEEIPPHITVAYHPFVPEVDWPRVRPLIVACLAGFEPFEVTLRELGMFTDRVCVLWLKPEDGGVLARMHAALERCLPAYVPVLPLTYVPHLTIGLFDSEAALLQARDAVLPALRPFHFRVEELAYMVLGNGAAGRVVDRLPLGRR